LAVGAADAARCLPTPAPLYLALRLGRDYHRLMRLRLQKLCDKIAAAIGPFGHRASSTGAGAGKALARNAGWLDRQTHQPDRSQLGLVFLSGEIYVDVELPSDTASTLTAHLQRLHSRLPHRAIVAPYRLDARRCISYLTIELKGEIPVELRRAMGNRIYGCDDCQLVCP